MPSRLSAVAIRPSNSRRSKRMPCDRVVSKLICTASFAASTASGIAAMAAAVRKASSIEVAKALPSWKGKTIIDATNAFGFLVEELDGLPSSAFVAKAFSGARLVKGFNHLAAATLAADPIVEGGHRAVFLSSDDEDAIGPVAALAKQLGFAPVKLGKLDEGGALVHARGRTWGQLIF